MNKREKGREGEDAAAVYLKRLGYKIIERNYNAHCGEIDIVARDGDAVVFCEVKARTNDSFGLPRESVTPYKQRKYFLAATEYMKHHRLFDTPVRFDVVEILAGKLTHIKNAFQANM